MTTTVAIADWIKRVADDERKRDAARVREDELAARKADLVRMNGRRLIDELRAAITNDVEAFRSEFPGDSARAIVIDEGSADGGFVVRKSSPGGVTLTVSPNLEGASTICHYHFARAGSLPPLEDRIELIFASDGGDTLRLKHHKTGQMFAAASALSELLLVPVLTGRPR
jgi:hypothetical protein